jgi:hypothetical protein
MRLNKCDTLYPLLKARWREFAILGLINNALPHALIFYGETEIGAGLAASSPWPCFDATI